MILKFTFLNMCACNFIHMPYERILPSFGSIRLLLYLVLGLKNLVLLPFLSLEFRSYVLILLMVLSYNAYPSSFGVANLQLLLIVFFFTWLQPVIVDEKGVEIEGECSGYLCIRSSWPGAFRTLHGDHERYETTYFKPFPGYYFSGDGCSR